MKEKSKYYKCDKCGEAIRELRHPSLRKIEDTPTCTKPITYGTSNICGGSFSIELTEEEYNKQLKDWKEK